MDFLSRVSVVGLGFIGLAMAVHIASKGHTVIASSNEQQKVDTIGKGDIPFLNRGLNRLLEASSKTENWWWSVEEKVPS